MIVDLGKIGMDEAWWTVTKVTGVASSSDEGRRGETNCDEGCLSQIDLLQTQIDLSKGPTSLYESLGCAGGRLWSPVLVEVTGDWWLYEGYGFFVRRMY